MAGHEPGSISRPLAKLLIFREVRFYTFEPLTREFAVTYRSLELAITARPLGGHLSSFRCINIS